MFLFLLLLLFISFLFVVRSMSALNDYLQDISHDNLFDNSVGNIRRLWINSLFLIF